MVQSSNLKFPSRRFSLTPSGLCSAIRFKHRIHLFLDELAVALQELLIDDTGVILGLAEVWALNPPFSLGTLGTGRRFCLGTLGTYGF